MTQPTQSRSAAGPVRLMTLLMTLVVLAGSGLLGLGVRPATAATATSATDPGAPLAATIRRTEYGIPHITATSFTGLGYGYGYAFATDDICVMADDYVTVDAQRSRYFGPTGTYLQRGNGFSSSNLDSDLFWQQEIDSGVAEKLLALAPPIGVRPELRQLVTGYTAGWNRYLADVGGPAGIRDPACHNAAWVHPLTEIEVYRRLYQLLLLASQGVAIGGIAQAQPPTPTAPVGAAGTAGLDIPATVTALGTNLHTAIGSNAVAVGRDGTRDHTHGLLLGNPHFPWLGTERFYEAQLTIPGVIDVEGGMLFGVPLVLIGHTQNMAWSHTVSTAFRFTPYQLTLVPGSPTTYLLDGVPTPMTSRTVTVQVRQPNGSLAPLSRTLWSTRYGPMVSSLVGVPLPWTTSAAFTMRDANADNVRAFNHFLETDMAQSVAEELAILNRYEGIPWVNTIVADRAGNAMYADIGAVPNVPNALAQTCNTILGSATYGALGLPILDGSRAACDWATDPDAPEPGVFGTSHLPHLLRADYVTNSNDSYWLSNPKQPLTGFARIIGNENAERSLRTRIGLVMTQARVDGSDGLGPAGFTRQDMQNLDWNDRSHAAELTRDALVSLCTSFPGGMAPTSSGTPVAVGKACTALASWNLRDDIDQRGALLFRRFWTHAVARTTLSSPVGGPDVPTVFTTPFSSTDAVHTPNTLNTASAVVQTALGDAISDLNGAQIPLDATLGSQQHVTIAGNVIPIHGGDGDPHGDFNAIYPGFDPTRGFTDVTEGSSFIQVVTWHDGTSCPDVANILTYSLSADPTSAHAQDQTRLFAAKQWVTERFCAADVLASPALQTVTLGNAAPAATAMTPSLLPDTGAAAGGAAGAVAVGILTLVIAGRPRGRRRH